MPPIINPHGSSSNAMRFRAYTRGTVPMFFIRDLSVCNWARTGALGSYRPTATVRVRPREKERLLLLSMTFAGKSIYQPSLARLLATATATVATLPPLTYMRRLHCGGREGLPKI